MGEVFDGGATQIDVVEVMNMVNSRLKEQGLE